VSSMAALGSRELLTVEYQSKWAVSTVQCKCYSQTVGLLAGGGGVMMRKNNVELSTIDHEFE
jgi:hypothetical protein